MRLTCSLFDVALSLIFIFFIFSLFVSGITEFINAMFYKRADCLEKALLKVLKPKLTQFLYEHPMVASMVDIGKKKPSYLSSKVFAQTVIDLLIQEFKKANPTDPVTLDAIKKTAQNLPKEIKDEVGNEIHHLFEALTHDIQAGKNELNDLRVNLEGWFNDYMDRVSGWYKAHTQTWLWIISFVVAASLNVDTVSLTKTLYSDKPLRDAIVQEAITVTAHDTLSVASKTAMDVDSANVKSKTDKLMKLRNNIDQMQLPIGWNIEVAPDKRNAMFYVLKLLGFLITTAALSFGAPFWFDLLVKMVNIRNTGNKPEKK